MGSKYTLEVRSEPDRPRPYVLLNSAGRKDEDRSSFLPEPKTWYTCLNLNLQLSDCEFFGVPFTRKLVHSCSLPKSDFSRNSAGRKDEDRSCSLPEPETWSTCLNLNLQLSDCECCGVPFTLCRAASRISAGIQQDARTRGSVLPFHRA